MKKINKKVWYAIGAVVVILIAWSMLRGGKKEEKVSLSKDKEMLYLVKFTETELRALYRLLLNGVCTVRSKNLYEGLHTASEKIYKAYVNNFYGGHE